MVGFCCPLQGRPALVALDWAPQRQEPWGAWGGVTPPRLSLCSRLCCPSSVMVSVPLPWFLLHPSVAWAAPVLVRSAMAGCRNLPRLMAEPKETGDRQGSSPRASGTELQEATPR